MKLNHEQLHETLTYIAFQSMQAQEMAAHANAVLQNTAQRLDAEKDAHAVTKAALEQARRDLNSPNEELAQLRAEVERYRLQSGVRIVEAAATLFANPLAAGSAVSADGSERTEGAASVYMSDSGEHKFVVPPATLGDCIQTADGELHSAVCP